jgi:hypothetical protein
MILAHALPLLFSLLARQQTPPIPELQAAGRVSEERALESVRRLVALGPRMGGTHSGDAAAEWLAAEFSAAGLQVRTVEDPLLDAHEEDSFSLTAHIAAGDGEDAVSLPLDHAWPYGYSCSGVGRISLHLESVAGKGWLAESMPRRSARSGVGLLLIDGRNSPDGAWPVTRDLQARADNPFPVFGISRPEGERLRRALAAGRTVEIDFQLVSHYRRAQPRTVIASLAAREGAPAGHLLFSAHGDSDSGGPGANDNASGEAVLLEIARAWSASIAAGELPPPPRELRFAIWGSEIHSSRAYLESARRHDKSDPLLAVINFDQAGYGSGADQLNVEPDDLPANVGLVRVLAETLAAHAGSDGFPKRWATNGSLGGTDSYVFSRSELFRESGRPSVTLFSSAWDEGRELPRTPGMPGESWSDRDQVSLD